MQRLSAEDQVMLWPDEIWPQKIGTVAVLDGGGRLDPGGRYWSRRYSRRTKRGPRTGTPAVRG